MDSKIIYALGLLNIRPATYDSVGWFKLKDKYNVNGILKDLDPELDKSLPASKKDFDSVCAEYAKGLSAPVNGTVLGINADEYVTLSPDKKAKEFERWIGVCEKLFFPAYTLSLNQLIKNYLVDTFKFKYASDGKRIVYRKVVDIDYANIWEEVPDSEHPFTKLQGKGRTELKTLLVTTCQAKEVDVYYKGNDKKRPCLVENVPMYKLYRKYRDQIIGTIKGQEDNVNDVVSEFDSYVSDMKRKHDSRLSDWEIQQGMHKLPELLEAMDEGVDDFSFLYDPDFKPVNLTNDPEECAFAYFDLDSITDGPTPNFDGFLSAIVSSCRDMFMAALFATIFAKSLLNQYVWIHGEGGDGKTSFLQALMRYLGERLCCSLSQTLSSEFGLEDAVGKRVVVLSDVKTGLSVKNGIIHNLTGHDPVSVNRKNKPIITTTLEPIVWIAANDAPDVNFDNRNEARRCLYIKMQEPSVEVQKKFYFTDEKGNFVLDSSGRKINNGYDLTGKLLEEMPHILYKCKKAFNEVCPSPYHVIRPSVEATQLAETNCIDIDSNTWKTYLLETFEFTGNDEDRMLLTDIYEAVEDTKASHSDRTAMNNFVRRDIKRLLTAAFDCHNKKVKGYRYIAGLKKKVQDG